MTLLQILKVSGKGLTFVSVPRDYQGDVNQATCDSSNQVLDLSTQSEKTDEVNDVEGDEEESTDDGDERIEGSGSAPKGPNIVIPQVMVKIEKAGGKVTAMGSSLAKKRVTPAPENPVEGDRAIPHGTACEPIGGIFL
jgi:hypothetical protein